MVRIALFNASPDTGNLGVSALGYSVISGLARRIPNLSLTVADSGFGIRPDVLEGEEASFEFDRCGVRVSRRWYLPESLWNIRMSSLVGGAWNPIAKRLLNQDIALDITGGDSFTDLYGTKRFRSGTNIKEFFLRQGIPLGLLPQTYGPFHASSHNEKAATIVRRSQFAWARDPRSFLALRKLLGNRFDPQLHQCGVDVAFLLESVAPTADEIAPIPMSWLKQKNIPTVGLNVSGLIYNNPEAAVSQYGFVADYRQIICLLVERLLNQSDARILLIPHVVVPTYQLESDIAACQDVLQKMAGLAGGRLAVLPALNDPRRVKWIISHCDWFCGTRMHATIAGLSTGVPTSAIAYSVKTAGVFETCGQNEQVSDPRTSSTTEVADQLWRSWQNRITIQESLSRVIPQVLKRANDQMDAIASACERCSESAPKGAIPK